MLSKLGQISVAYYSCSFSIRFKVVGIIFPDLTCFDSFGMPGMTDNEKKSVLEGFSNGNIKIVFATSAFGMGVDISDIRVVVNYLISETVEQYYQEVGRGGRDGQPAYGYLLYTNQSKRGRMMLLNNSQ